MSERSHHARLTSGHTEAMLLKLHPDLMAYVRKRAAEDYCSLQEMIRKLIVNDMRDRNGDV